MDMLTSYYPKLIAQQLKLSRADFEQLLIEANLSLNQVRHEDFIPHESFLNFLAKATKFVDNPAIGLIFGHRSRPYLAGEMSLMWLKAPNLLEGLRGFVNYSRIQASYIQFELHTSQSHLTIYASFNVELGQSRRTQTEVMLLTLQNFIEDYIGTEFDTGHFGFDFPEPSYAEQYKQPFHSKISFNESKNYISIPKYLFDTDSIFYDQRLWKQGLALCEQQMQSLELRHKKLYSQRVLDILNSQPPPLPKLTGVAKMLNLSERTLSRRLQHEDNHFRALYNQVIQEWAVQYLSNKNLSIEVISAELGFQDCANFRRAFKRYWGITPQVYREERID